VTELHFIILFTMPDQAAAERALHDQTNLLSRSQLLIVFSALSLTLLITFIDQNGISVALPTIAKDLNAQATISWAGTSSLIANTVFSMLYGRLSDLVGRKAVFIGAVGLLVVADLLCGLSQNSTMLYVFRAFAGVAGGGITNLTMILVSDIVTLEERGKYQGILGAFVGLGNVLGPFLGAAFIEKSTWRGFFYLLAPLGAACGTMAWWLLPTNAPQDGVKETIKKIDLLGVLTSSVGIIFLLIPISGGGAYFPWNSALVISFLSIGVASFISFLLVEWKVARLPMMPRKLQFSSTEFTPC
jgi:MFS family permease